MRRSTISSPCSSNLRFTFNVEIISSKNEKKKKKEKLDSTNTRPASHLPILSMIMCIKYLRNQNITYIYIYNKYVIREEFSFSSISFALSLHQFTKREKKEKKKKEKKKDMNKNDRVVLCTAWFVAKCIHLCVAVAAT